MKLFLLLLVASSLSIIEAAEYQLVKGHTDVSFTVKHMLISKTRGVFKEFKGDFLINDSHNLITNLNVEIQANSIFTNDIDRDNHLKNADFFDVDKHPSMFFKIDKLSYVENKKLKTTGVLTIKSIERNIPVEITFNGIKESPFDSKKYGGFSLKTSINRKNFDMTFNKTLDNGGLAIDDNVLIEISGEFTQKK